MDDSWSIPALIVVSRVRLERVGHMSLCLSVGTYSALGHNMERSSCC
ncbi:hypothetical protein VPHD529_0009 [Vibrio phage D529]